MSKPTVYLAGPILGCTKAGANDWRRAVAEELAGHGILGISPLRCEPLTGPIYAASYVGSLWGDPKAIFAKNLMDTRKADLVLAYLPAPEPGRHQSYGTIAELAWARMLDKPAIVVTNDPDVIDHPVLTNCAGWMLPDFHEAVEVIVGLLAGYSGGKSV